MGRAARILHPSTLMGTDGEQPHDKLNDLSRSLTPLKPDRTLIAVIEMSLIELARCRDSCLASSASH